jgi:hypothetical protein
VFSFRVEDSGRCVLRARGVASVTVCGCVVDAGLAAILGVIGARPAPFASAGVCGFRDDMASLLLGGVGAAFTLRIADASRRVVLGATFLSRELRGVRVVDGGVAREEGGAMRLMGARVKIVAESFRLTVLSLFTVDALIFDCRESGRGGWVGCCSLGVEA